MTRMVLSLGSNIQRHKHICFALKALHAQFGPLQRSPVYKTRAVGFNGPDFYNLVVVADVDEELETLVRKIRQIELDAGRIRGEKCLQSRTLDIDILLLGEADFHPCGYDIPRQEIESAAYVLKPLADILPRARHPVSGARFDALWRDFSASDPGLEPIRFECET